MCNFVGGGLQGHSEELIWHTWTWRDEESITWSETSTAGFVAVVLSPLGSWAELLHYTKLHAAVPKWLPLRFRLSVRVSEE